MTTVVATLQPADLTVGVVVTGLPAGVTQVWVRRIDSGGTIVPVRGGDPYTVNSGGATLVDVEGPYDDPFYYNVANSTGATLYGNSNGVTIPSTGRSRLIDPTVPSLSVELGTVIGLPDITYAARQGRFDVIGRIHPVVLTGAVQSSTGTLSVRTETLNDRDDMLGVLASGRVLLLSTPGASAVGSIYVSIGDIVETRVLQRYDYAPRVWTLPLTVVARPIGVPGATAGGSWADVISNYATWADVVAEKASWSDLLTHVAPNTGPPTGIG